MYCTAKSILLHGRFKVVWHGQDADGASSAVVLIPVNRCSHAAFIPYWLINSGQKIRRCRWIIQDILLSLHQKTHKDDRRKATYSAAEESAA